MEPFHKTVLITGSARRVGAALVRACVAAGYKVVAHYHTSRDEAEALIAEFPGAIVMSVQADLAKPSECQRVAEEIRSRHGYLTALINNASKFYPTPIATASPDEWEDLFNSNVKAAYFLTQACRDLLEKTEGCVVNITDIHAEQAMTPYSIYCMAKAAWRMQTKALAKEFAPKIRVNSVAPGAVMLPEGVNELDEATREKIRESTALQRMGSPQDICHAVLFMLENSYITGQTLHVDGGRLKIREEVD